MAATTLPRDAGLSLEEVAAFSPAEDATQRIREWIVGGELPAGKRLPSERVLAERLSVSRAAVRAAFDTLEQEGLVISAPRRARIVRPAPPEAERKDLMTQTVAALVEPGFAGAEFGKGRPAWGGRLRQGLADAFIEAGLGILFVAEDQLRGPGVEQLLSAPPRGLIVVHTAADLPTREALLKALHVGDIPVVVWGDEHEWPGCDVVVSDHEQGSYDRARWLIEQGRRRLLRCRPAGLSVHDWVLRRDAGFERALAESGLPVLPPLEIHGLHEVNGSHADFLNSAHLLAGYLFRHLTGPEPADTILAVSDGFVPELTAACRILGKEPNEDVALAGYDNYWRECMERQWESTPPAMTVDKDDRRIGIELAKMLLQRMAGELPPEPQRRVIAQKRVVMEGQ